MREVKITLVPKEQIMCGEDMFCVSCEDYHPGWGKTLAEAIRNFDEENE